MRRVLSVVRPHLARLIAAGLAGVTAELCAVALMASAAWLIARASQQPPLAALSLAIVAVRAFAVFRGVLRYADRLAGHDATLRALAELRGRVYDSLARAAVPAPGRPVAAGAPGGEGPARRRTPGKGGARRDADALGHMVADVDSLQDLLLRCLLPITSAVAVAVVAAGLALVLLPAAGLVAAAGLLVAGLAVPACAALAARRLGARVAEARDALAARSLDLLDGRFDLAAFGATARVLERAEAETARLARLEGLAGRVSSIAFGAGVLVQGLTAVGVAGVAIAAGADEVLVAVLALTTLAAFEPVLPLADAAQRLTELRPAARRLAALLEDAPQAPAPARAAGPDAAELELRDVTVRYAPDGPAALDGVSLRVEPDRSLAVVGASGAGKSTLLGVLAGLLPPTSGTALVPPGVRGLTQDAHVFHTSIRANLLLARPAATEDELREAARRTRLLEWVESLPEGWDTEVGEGGRPMSGGQRQRLLLTRALLADPGVLVLDEPTEALDHALADRVLAGVLAARRGRATVLVTHRLTGLDAVDEIIVMDEGRIVQRGTHAGLTGIPGPYRDLWDTERLVSSPAAA
ncbi:thiol reductant ABC exporter subunit CydC [Bailinhaonella thermotolerans]|uniref:Thiol reductant ABC exporter subunit CydC n=1 Tax=Bailinhaonella thermotolerans TaxID=1070861 RepID=A0A3A4AYR2_9ACTN|nr:thiol reductant ABC exporter subunit CydC [Bailinhaonella thermotolerans]RJL32646.1 thiol reductant ABC exporter subunit CydC [Bailinhaonella thermotolerans]